MDQNYLILYLNDFISGFDKGCLKILRKTYLGMFETLCRRQKYFFLSLSKPVKEVVLITKNLKPVKHKFLKGS